MDRTVNNMIYSIRATAFNAFMNRAPVYMMRSGNRISFSGASLFCTDSEIDEILSTGIRGERTATDDKLILELHWNWQSLERIEQLIQEGANVNCVDDRGSSLLHHVYDPDLAALLIERGANVNAAEATGSTPLHIAVRHDNFLQDITTTLLFYNADTSIHDLRGNTPIMDLMRNPSFSKHLIDKITLLMRYECDFSYVNGTGASLLTLAMITQRQCFGDAIIERGGNFSTLSKDLEVLMWCISQSSPDEFKWFWNVFNYKNAWFFKQPILYHLFIREKYDAFNYIIESSKLRDVLDVWFGDHENKKGTILYKLECQEEEFTLVHILNATARNYNRERAERTIYILLTNGYELREHEVLEIYKVFGYGELFVLCLNLDVSGYGSPYSFSSLIPKILLNPDRSSQEIINECVLSESDQSMKSRELLIATISHVSHHSSHEYLKEVCSSQEISCRLLPSRVPSLQELSRNQALLGIWKKYEVEKRSQFWNVMKNIPLPTMIKDLILFKSPIYNYRYSIGCGDATSHEEP